MRDQTGSQLGGAGTLDEHRARRDPAASSLALDASHELRCSPGPIGVPVPLHERGVERHQPDVSEFAFACIALKIEMVPLELLILTFHPNL